MLDAVLESLPAVPGWLETAGEVITLPVTVCHLVKELFSDDDDVAEDAGLTLFFFGLATAYGITVVAALPFHVVLMAADAVNRSGNLLMGKGGEYWHQLRRRSTEHIYTQQPGAFRSQLSCTAACL
jgi:hypothetical protein